MRRGLPFFIGKVLGPLLEKNLIDRGERGAKKCISLHFEWSGKEI